ncbi:uncharacterized protein LOC124416462 [Diprion similis]|uniref:uncharacterized protein LOC124416462 n=1 Tax=Diprion similis TaxID=362088 RepID=UPI001EF75AD1|nr:uncharacterized protein LOC124416462 [Diprion similis]
MDDHLHRRQSVTADLLLLIDFFNQKPRVRLRKRDTYLTDAKNKNIRTCFTLLSLALVIKSYESKILSALGVQENGLRFSVASKQGTRTTTIPITVSGSPRIHLPTV